MVSNPQLELAAGWKRDQFWIHHIPGLINPLSLQHHRRVSDLSDNTGQGTQGQHGTSQATETPRNPQWWVLVGNHPLDFVLATMGLSSSSL